MRAQRRDANERDIIDYLHARGFSVDQLEGGNGRPDLLVGDPLSPGNILMEIKQEGKSLNPIQVDWHAKWLGQKSVVHNTQEAADVIAAHRKNKNA